MERGRLERELVEDIARDPDAYLDIDLSEPSGGHRLLCAAGGGRDNW